MADPEAPAGQVAAEPTGTTVAAPDGQVNGQSVTPIQTTGNGTVEGGESFFDYETIRGKPELEAAYKEMQGAFTKKNDVFAKGRDKITQYDQFMQNPVETMRQLAQQYGYQMVQGQPQDADGTPKNYENWDQVMEEAERRVMEKIQPMFGEMQNMKKQNVEQALDNSFPDWRAYEDSMMENLQAHPTLVNDHEKLYQMSVPQEVLNARATKVALAKIQGTTESGLVQSQSTTTQQPTKSPKIENFNDAVKFAKQDLARRGIKPPTGE